MTSPALILALASVWGQTIPDAVIEKQNEVFQRLWAEDFVWKFDELPTEGKVAEHRIPYSGYIYPDSARGTMQVLRKYDSAFSEGDLRATLHEQRDTSLTRPITRRETYTHRGLFGRRRTVTRLVRAFGVPHWYGHCNGWTAAAMRHAEPQNNVTRHGVEFTPADIKALLAEIYIYNEHIVLAGGEYRMNPGSLHAIIANWLGRGKHPVAMESDPGAEKWNYPIYSFTTSRRQLGRNRVDVRMDTSYAKNSRSEFQQSPRIEGKKHFHYALNLDDEGNIVGGYWYRDSSRIDMLWIPLQPKSGGQPGNERGNPHVDVDEVLAIWRESVPKEIRITWLIVDPAPLDRVLEAEELAETSPAQEPEPVAEPPAESVAAAPFNAETAGEAGDAAGPPAPPANAEPRSTASVADARARHEPDATMVTAAEMAERAESDPHAPEDAASASEPQPERDESNAVTSSVDSDDPDADEQRLLAMRRWVDNTGHFEVEARLIAILDGQVRLLKNNERTCTVPLNRLSNADLTVVKQAQQRYGAGMISP